MLTRSWDDSLRQTLNRLASRAAPERPRVAVVGSGQELRGDDGVGSVIAGQLQARLRPAAYRLVLDGGPAPESQTGRLRRFRPAAVILIDAAQMDEAPGTIRWLSWEATHGMSASTHSLPPHLVARYLTTTPGCEVFLIAVQPASAALGAQLSPALQRPAEAATAVLEAALQPNDALEACCRKPSPAMGCSFTWGRW